jgi:hypothetical protein
MKFNLNTTNCQNKITKLISMLKVLLIAVLFLPGTMFAALPVIAAGTVAIIALAVASGTLFLVVIRDSTGNYELAGRMWKYDRKTTTKYSGLRIDVNWVAEQPNVGANWKCRYTNKCDQYIEQYVRTDEFTIAEMGSSGDVQLEVRDSSCDRWVGDVVDGQLYQWINKTQFHYRTKVSYKISPWYTPDSKTVKAVLVNWTPELQRCDEESRYRFTTASFSGDVPSNGEGEIVVKSRWLNNGTVQLSSGPGAGVAFKQ